MRIFISIIVVALVAASCSHPSAEKSNANAESKPQASTQKPQAVSIATGKIEVTSTPPGARVILIETDEAGARAPQPRGVTPLTITELVPGNYTVHLEMPGYRFFHGHDGLHRLQGLRGCVPAVESTAVGWV